MTRHPSENFIKYLITSSHQWASNDDWVKMTVTQLGYPPVDADYLVWLRTSLTSRLPSGFDPQNRYHRESVKFLRTEGIYSIHNPDRPLQQANLIVTNLRARPIIENLLLGRMEPKDVAKKVNARLGDFFTTESIEAYQHYYWNVSIIKVEDWAVLLEGRDVEKSNALAIVQVGPSLALHKMGFQQAIDSKTILRETMEALYFDLKEWKTRPLSASRTKAMTTIARGMVQIDAQLSQADSALKDSLKAFEQFRMQHSESMVPDIRDLAPAGNYSNSGAKLLEATNPEEDK